MITLYDATVKFTVRPSKDYDGFFDMVVTMGDDDIRIYDENEETLSGYSKGQSVKIVKVPTDDGAAYFDLVETGQNTDEIAIDRLVSIDKMLKERGIESESIRQKYATTAFISSR